MAQITTQTSGGNGSLPRRRLQPAERRRELLDVAAQIVAEQGQDAVTMERLAATAGVSNGLVYRYFDDRADVLLALLEEHWAALDEELAAQQSQARSFEDLVKATTHSYIHAVRRRGEAFRRLNYERSVEPSVEEKRQARRAEYLETFARNYQREFDLTPEVARTASVMLVGAIEAAAERMTSAELDADTIEAVQVALVMNGVATLRNGLDLQAPA